MQAKYVCTKCGEDFVDLISKITHECKGDKHEIRQGLEATRERRTEKA